MTCKDCIHEKVCIDKHYYDEDSILSCDDFKNKADFVEVVRCGECQYWKLNPYNLHGGYCRHCEGASIDHFCSYGKRK